MRRTGNNVAGRGWRSARHHKRLRWKAPRGVAPSPSRLLALMPVRPSATGNASGPAVSTPRELCAGLRRTASRRNDVSCFAHGTLRNSPNRGQIPVHACSFSPECSTSRIFSRGDHYAMPNRRSILIVDDDAELREALVEQLALHEEFDAIAVDSGTKGVQAAKSGQIDLVIMDVGLPDVDGREAVRILRKNGFKAPIIMLTGHDTDSDTILGLESGANDYVSKPFRFAV